MGRSLVWGAIQWLFICLFVTTLVLAFTDGMHWLQVYWPLWFCWALAFSGQIYVIVKEW